MPTVSKMPRKKHMRKIPTEIVSVYGPNPMNGRGYGVGIARTKPWPHTYSRFWFTGLPTHLKYFDIFRDAQIYRAGVRAGINYQKAQEDNES